MSGLELHQTIENYTEQFKTIQVNNKTTAKLPKMM